MYEAVVNQVYLLCSLSTATYEIHEDRKAMQRDDHREEDFLVKVRIYWYCFGGLFFLLMDCVLGDC